MSASRYCSAFCLGLTLGACATNPAPTAPTAPPPRTSSAPKTAKPQVAEPTLSQTHDLDQRLTTLSPSPRPDLQKYFTDERVHGTLALFDSATGRLSCSDVERCQKRYLPASTFKIANTLIGLELGLLSDAETPMPWNGEYYSVPAWNQDHTLRSAVRVSCVPCFQELAGKVGPERMQAFLDALDYGNHSIEGGIERFWLDGGGLRISPVEQLDFLRRLDHSKLPVKAAHREVVSDVLTLDVGPSYVLRGKTGSARSSEQSAPTGWFVGWVELSERRVYFATLIDGSDLPLDIIPVRRRLTERALTDLGILPKER